MSSADDSLLDTVTRHLSEPPAGDAAAEARSMLLQLATAYSAGEGPLDSEVTQPTGFNPHNAALFESVLESAFLVANADGHFDEVERKAFVRVVRDACEGAVGDAQIEALLSDLDDLLTEDGLDKRIEMVGRAIVRPEHGEEVLRIAGLLAYVSAGVSDVERGVLDKLCSRFGLAPRILQRVLAEVASAVSNVTAD